MFSQFAKKISNAFIPCMLLIGISHASPLNISDSPLFVTQTVPPLTMLVLGRNHKLYYEAYNDASDLNGDGVLDIRYTPEEIDYYGYFDSFKCYTYNGGSGRFEPASVTATKKCAGQWSGDYLNYLTTARIDAMRKVLYGGYRSTDTPTLTVLERSHIPQDAHSWGKEYTSVAVDGFNISEYTPYSLPTGGRRHLFANTTLLKSGSGEPRLRVLLNQPYRIWEWVSIERPVANNRVVHGGNGPIVAPTDFFVRVVVCDSAIGLEENCQSYPAGDFKPTGLLHTFGETGAMKFGMISGSYGKNMSGGVMRKEVGEFSDEIDPNTGQFNGTNGIVATLDKLRIPNFGGSYVHQSNCGFIFNRAFREGECRSWGNPIAEMMYESMRYFSGRNAATPGFVYAGGDDVNLGLPLITAWSDPYDPANNPYCAKPNIIVLSDTYPSFDGDQLPGNTFNPYGSDLTPGMNVTALGDIIWANEVGGASQHFIGESNGAYDGTPSIKATTSFSTMRGLPYEPAKQGTYHSASVAYYGFLNDISQTAEETQQVATWAIALSSPLPQIDIDVNGKIVTIVPFAKSVGGCGGINRNQGQFQPSDTLVDFYVESLTATTGTFRVNWEDVGQGADHDMDAIVRYEYVVNPDGTLTITLTSTYAAGCVQQHMGYVISGTTADGPYLEVRDFDTSAGADADYFLDTPPGQPPGGTWNDGNALPLTTSRTFTPSATPSVTLLKNPLWYAAKWGGFIDSDGNNLPNMDEEWDSDGDGVPDTYFLVTNPANLVTQLSSALQGIIERSSSATAASLNSGSLNTDTRLYQAVFESQEWSGQLLSFSINTSNGSIDTSGSGPGGSLWDASDSITRTNWGSRVVLTHKPSTGTGVAFRWPSNYSSPTATDMDKSQALLMRLNPDTGLNDSKGIGKKRIKYIRGQNSQEVDNGGTFRNRDSDLGDIIHSAPLFVGKPRQHYRDTWPKPSDPENANAYSTFKSNNTSRQSMVYVGANDGMLHGINADSGDVVFSYVPNPVIKNLSKLTSINYAHTYYVDGSTNYNDAYFAGNWHTVLVGGLNKGGQGVYALDITNPTAITEANAANVVLWEFDDTDDADMGYSYSQPAIVRMQNGVWAAIFGNGYNNTIADGNPSATGNAVLYIVNIENGSLIKKIDTEFGAAEDPTGAGRPNGLATAAIVDTNGDNIADAAYAGDLFGNMWKFNLNSSNINDWDVAFTSGSSKQPLYVARDSAGNRQPITSRPSVGFVDGKVGVFQVYFGTGKYLEDSDKTDVSVQTVYGIEDANVPVTGGRAALVGQQILGVSVQGTISYRITTNNVKLNQPGWYIDLEDGVDEGERLVTNVILRHRHRLIFSTLIPSDDPCEFGGTGWLMEINAQDGSRLENTPFDVNADGSFSNADMVSQGGSQVTVSGRRSNVGIIPSPGIISTPLKEYKYTPGTSGAIEKIDENPGPNQTGRQSWRQLR